MQSEVAVPVQELFDFHLDTTNLPKITPPNLKVDIIEIPKPMHKGGIVVLEVTKFWLKQQWKVEIIELNSPHIITDKAIKSPFAEFVHEHTFKEVGRNTSLLCDNVYFALPFAPLSSIIIPLVKQDIRRMFAYRHQETKRILEKR